MSDKTKWIFENDDTPGGQPSRDFTETLGATEQVAGAGASPYDPTRLVNRFEEKTQLQFADAIGIEEETDPVVGWLVVVKGPGLGRSINIGAGMNVVGRAEGCRVALPFGDQTISGDDHLRIIYDDSSRTFLLAPGTGKNITRVNGQVVTATMALPNRSVIELSKKTVVRFMAFCDDGFDWSDLAGQGS